MAAPDTTLAAVLQAVCPRVYPDANTAEQADAPYIVWTQVGGQVIDTVNDPADLYHARIQLAAWAPRRIDANALIRQAEAAMRAAAAFQAKPIGALLAHFDPDTQLRGALQDFAVWYRL